LDVIAATQQLHSPSIPPRRPTNAEADMGPAPLAFRNTGGHGGLGGAYAYPHAHPSAPMTTAAAVPLPSFSTSMLPPAPAGDAHLARELEHEEGMVELLTAAIERALGGGGGLGAAGNTALKGSLATTAATTAATAAAAANLPDWNHPASVFFSVKVPEISIRSYVGRLCKYAQCSPTAFVVALVYMRRLASCDPTLVLSQYNLHRLLITSLCVGAKFLDDRCFSNAHYARVGGIPSVKEMNRLELHVMKILDFRMFVSSTEFAVTQKEVLLLAYDASPRRSLPDVKPQSPYHHQEPPYSPITASSPDSVLGGFQREISPMSSEGYAAYANVSPAFAHSHMHYDTPGRYMDRATSYVTCPSYAPTCMSANSQPYFIRDPGLVDPYQALPHVQGFAQQPPPPLHTTTLYRPHHVLHPAYARSGQAHAMGKPRSFAGQTGPAMLYGRAPPPAMQGSTPGYPLRSFQAVNS
jgi:hypothetical protein